MHKLHPLVFLDAGVYAVSGAAVDRYQMAALS